MSFKQDKIENLLKQCRVIAENSKCSRKQFGAILVKADGVAISAGYNGSPRGTYNCGKEIECLKDLYDEAHYVSYDHCPAVHAELNAVINAARIGVPTVGTYLFLNSADDKSAGEPCIRCKRDLLNAGVEGAYIKMRDGSIQRFDADKWKKDVNDWMKSMELEGRIEKRTREEISKHGI